MLLSDFLHVLLVSNVQDRTNDFTALRSPLNSLFGKLLLAVMDILVSLDGSMLVLVVVATRDVVITVIQVRYFVFTEKDFKEHGC